jgi:hypothetical protein
VADITTMLLDVDGRVRRTGRERGVRRDRSLSRPPGEQPCFASPAPVANLGMHSSTVAAQRFLATARAVVACGALLIATFIGAAGIAGAQTPAALPTAPGAGPKAAQGGYTAARASLPGDNGSPLEPYLFLFILAGGGVVAWALAIGTDINVRRNTRPIRR